MEHGQFNPRNKKLLLLLLLTAIWLSAGGSGYITCGYQPVAVVILHVQKYGKREEK